MRPSQPMAQGSLPPRVLIVGYGDLGHAIGKSLAEEGTLVMGLRRSECLHDHAATMIIGDVTKPATLAGLAKTNPHILVYCVAAPEQNDASYRAHYVDGLRHALAALDGARNLQHVFFVSSTRVYGQASDQLLSESDPANPADFGGERLLEAEHLLSGQPFGHTALRLSGIYGPGRNRMLSLATAPSRWPQQNSWSNRIHRDDAAAFIVFLIQRALRGLTLENCYIVTDSCPAPQHEVLRWLADRTGHDVNQTPSPIPWGGKRLSNQRMLETGFLLRYPSYQAGYATLIQQASH